MKILATAPIPTEELFKLRSECEALYNHIDNLLRLSYVETPSEEAPKKEASFDDGFIRGLGVKQSPTKPVDLATE